MKEYQKPYIEDEYIEIEDICEASNKNGEKLDPFDIWGEDPEE